MLNTIPQSHQNLLKDDSKAFVFLATIMPDGSPQVSPVWFNTDGEYILINSALGRVKDRNMRARPQVALSFIMMDEPYHALQIRGKVVDVTTEGGAEHISVLSQKYRGHDYDIPDGQTRTIYKIVPEKINLM